MSPKSTGKTADESKIPAKRMMYKAPGRLGDPGMELYQEPRANKKLIATLAKYGIDRNRAPPSLATLTPTSTMAELGKSMAEAQAGFEKLYENLPNEIPADAIELEVVHEVESIPGPDNRTIKLHVFRPELRGGPLPCVVYLHGGGMTILKTLNKVHTRWCRSLAAQGMVVIAVDFRNAWTEEGFNPFPAGLNDCSTAVQYIHTHKDQFDIRNLVIQGESGGANLALATALKANREGWSIMIDGVWAYAPFISGAYTWPEERKLSELPSLVECHGYFLNVDYQAHLARVYSPRPEDMTNPLAWPLNTTRQDLEGLPPHILSMDELDPLRDEGVAYYRKLSAAGVKASGHVNLGQTHAASLIFRQALPESNRTAIRNIAGFVKTS